MSEGLLDDLPALDPNEPIDPERATRELRQSARALEAAGAKLGQRTKQFRGRVNGEEWIIGPGKRFENLVAARTVAIYEGYVSDGKRPPGEDVRKAKAEADVREEYPELAAAYDELSTDIFALKQFISSQKSAVEAHRSVLSASKVLSGLTN